MKQLVILSGKGGTGKTSLAAAFAQLACESQFPVKAVLADADVDAANMDLVLCPNRQEEHNFIGGAKAIIDDVLCSGCGRCEKVCRFDAILPPPNNMGDTYSIDPVACDGCAACVYQCTENAIHMDSQIVGHWFRSVSRYGALFHAELRPAQENSGKLVTLVKQQARLLALDGNYEVVIVDGPPGIGCPVISAASGADLTLIVAEPTAAGIHDMERVLQTTAHFRIPALVCINKADIYPAGAAKIEEYCRIHDLDLVGRIPFDATVTEAMMNGEPVTAYRPDSPASQAILNIWQVVSTRLFKTGAQT
jgi:MinD superfamily P-loop ATPase